ncbi:alanine racemase [Alkaliphilus crotonatoxidans]
MEQQLLRPVWAEINLDHLKHNLNEVKKIIKKNTLVCAVVKADAYGHGAREIINTLVNHGVDRLAVATMTEGIQLRRVGVKLPILIFGYTPVECWQMLLQYNLIQTVYTMEQARYLSEQADSINQKLKVHLKIDTGMSRLGFIMEEGIQGIEQVCCLPGLEVEGIYTHFAVADEKDKTYSYRQFNHFMTIIDQLEQKGISIPIKHASNSAAIIDLPDMNLDMVRPGIMLYGMYPSKEVDHERVKLKQVMTLKAKAAQVKELPPGRGISYGLIYRTKERQKIMTLPIGYADGFTRLFTNRSQVLVAGKKAPVVGRICMDQMMVDVTGLDVEMGQVVTIIGDDPQIGNTVDELAHQLQTINYEIVCMIGRRVPRLYMENNSLLQVRDSLLE